MADYHLDYEAFREHVLNAPWMLADMRARAERGKAFAESIAPYDPGSTDGTHYRDAFHVQAHLDGGIHHDRAVGILSNSDDAARYIEFGTEDTPEFATLRKALDVMGA